MATNLTTSFCQQMVTQEQFSVRTHPLTVCTYYKGFVPVTETSSSVSSDWRRLMAEQRMAFKTRLRERALIDLCLHLFECVWEGRVTDPIADVLRTRLATATSSLPDDTRRVWCDCLSTGVLTHDALMHWVRDYHQAPDTQHHHHFDLSFTVQRDYPSLFVAAPSVLNDRDHPDPIASFAQLPMRLYSLTELSNVYDHLVCKQCSTHNKGSSSSSSSDVRVIKPVLLIDDRR